MDLKAPPGQLHRVVSGEADDTPIWHTADILINSGVDYEFRTTFMPLLSVDDIAAIAQRVNGAKRYILQQYRKPEGSVPQPDPHAPDTIKKAAEAARETIADVTIRGL